MQQYSNINNVVTDTCYFLTAVHVSQQDVTCNAITMLSNFYIFFGVYQEIKNIIW
jgi:hypothetical protein